MFDVGWYLADCRAGNENKKQSKMGQTGFAGIWSAISHQYKHFLPHISSWTHPPALPEIKEFLQHEQQFHSALYFTSSIFPNKEHNIFLKTCCIQHPRANNQQDKMKIVLTLCLQVEKSLKRKGSGKDSIKSFSSCSTQYVFFFVCFSSSLKSRSESRIAYWQENNTEHHTNCDLHKDKTPFYINP